MALDPVLNFAKVAVSAGYAFGITSIVLSSGDGAKLPQPSTDGAFNLVWWNETDHKDPADDSSKEIVRCTARSTDTLTIVRAQEGTADVNHNTADKTYKMVLALTKKMKDDIGAMRTFDCVVAPSGGDYTTIQAAIAAGKHKIFVKDGTYTLSSNITFAVDETVLFGESWDVVISASTYYININGKKNCQIRNLKITGTGDYAIWDGNLAVENTIISNCYASSYGKDIYLQSTGGKYNRIEGNYLTGVWANRGIEVNSPDSLISKNVIFNQGTAVTSNAGIYGNAVRISIIGNVLSTLGASSGAGSSYGIVSLGSGGIIEGNIVYNLQGSSTSSEVIGIYGGENQIIVSNCLLNIANTSGGTTAVRGIRAGGSTVVANNILRLLGNATDSTLTMGIGVFGSALRIEGNIIKTLVSKATGGETNGILVSGGYHYTNISNNHIDSLSGETKYSIRINSGNNYSVVVGNYLSEPIYDVSLLSMIRMNSGVPITDEKQLIRMKNTSGGALVAGNVVILKSVAAGDEVTTTTTGGDKKVFGMLAENIADAAFGYIQTLGKTVSLKVNGIANIAIGDFLSTYTEAGIAKQAAAGEMAFAIALEAYAVADSLGVIDALLITPRLI